VEGVDVSWVGLQDLSIESLGLLPPPSLVSLHSPRQRFRHGHHRDCSLETTEQGTHILTGYRVVRTYANLGQAFYAQLVDETMAYREHVDWRFTRPVLHDLSSVQK